jgi:hypothetical protein
VQDKSAATRERSASDQPEQGAGRWRSSQLGNKGGRSHKLHDHATGFVPLTIHVPCVVRDEIERRAKKNGIIVKNGKRKSLSLSEVGRPIFTKGLQVDIDMQYGAMLQSIIERSIKREMRGQKSFQMLILSRIAFDIGQTRAMVANILARQPGVLSSDFENILKKSGATATDNITRITPQLTEIMQSIKELLGETEEGQQHATL